MFLWCSDPKTSKVCLTKIRRAGTCYSSEFMISFCYSALKKGFLFCVLFTYFCLNFFSSSIHSFKTGKQLFLDNRDHIHIIIHQAAISMVLLECFDKLIIHSLFGKTHQSPKKIPKLCFMRVNIVVSSFVLKC